MNLAWVLRVQSGGTSGCGRPRGARAGASSRAGVGNLAPSRVAANHGADATERARAPSRGVGRAPPSPSTSSRALATSPKVKTPRRPRATNRPRDPPSRTRRGRSAHGRARRTSPPAPPLPARCSSFSARRRPRAGGSTRAALIAHGHPTAPIQTPRQRAFESDEKRSSFLDDYRFALLLVVVAAIDARATEMTKYEGVRVACFARLRVSFSALDYVLYARHPIPSFRQSYHLRGTVSSRRSFAQPLRDVSPRDVVPRVV